MPAGYLTIDWVTYPVDDVDKVSLYHSPVHIITGNSEEPEDLRQDFQVCQLAITYDHRSTSSVIIVLILWNENIEMGLYGSYLLSQRFDPAVSDWRRWLEGQHRYILPGCRHGEKIPHCAHEVSMKLTLSNK